MLTSRNMENLLGETEISQKIPVRQIDMKSLLEKLLAPLSAKQKLVITSRFGIGNGVGQTLEAIGKNFNITRERVRQIESDAVICLKKIKRENGLAELEKTIQEVIKEKGNVASGQDLVNDVFSRYFGKNQVDPQDARGLEIVFLVAGLKKNKANREMNEVWIAQDFDKNYFNSVVAEMESKFEQSKKILSEEEILKKMHYSEAPKKYPDIRPEHIINFLNISKKFGKNVFGDWGKARWPLIRPRGVREKATLVLMKKRKPLHFRDISRLIEEYKLSAKKVHPQTVHNELIRDKRFVLVGRGTYALREWGYEEGTVKDVIVALLKSAQGILTKENIVLGVLKKRKVKKATIDVNLADKTTFSKTKEGYELKTKD